MDLWVFDMGLDPFSAFSLSGNFGINGYSQPPLLPFALAPLALVTSAVSGNFLASRISFTVFELAGFLLVARYLSLKTRFSNRSRAMALFILSVSPIGFMAGTVMRTEEAIVMIFTAALMLVLQKNRTKTASLIVFFGIITGKILFLIMFFPLLLVSDNFKTILKWGIFPTFVFLAAYSAVGYIASGIIPFIEFSPECTTFCLSIFSLAQHYVELSGNLMKWGSSILVLTIFVVIWRSRDKIDTSDFTGISLLSFLILFLLFYHITPEYLIFALPLLAVMSAEFDNAKNRWLFIGSHMILALSSSGFGIVYGLRIYSQGFSYKSSSKDLFLSIYQSIVPWLRLDLLEQLLLVISIISLLALLLLTIRHLRRAPAKVI